MSRLTALFVILLAFTSIPALAGDENENGELPDYTNQYINEYADSRDIDFQPSQAGLLPELEGPAAMLAAPSEADFAQAQEDSFLIRSEPDAAPELPLD